MPFNGSARMFLCESLCHTFHQRRRLSDVTIYFIFILLGVGVLVPWNAFISAVPYFQGRICSLPKASAQFESWVGFLFNLSSVGALILLMSWPWIVRKCRQSRRLPGTDERTDEIQTEHLGDEEAQQQSYNSYLFWFVTFPLFLFLLVFVVTDMLVGVKGISAKLFLGLTLLGLSICGAASAFATAGIITASGRFPANLGINPFVSGQAVGGVAVSAANFLSALAEDPGDYWNQHCTHNRTSITTEGETAECTPYDKFDTAVFLYFFVGAVVLLSCIVGFAILIEQTGARDQYETVHSERETSETPAEALDDPSPRFGIELSERAEEVVPSGLLHRVASQVSDQSSATVTSDAPKSILYAIRGPAFCIYFTYLVTLALFPAWTSRLHSIQQCQSHGRLANDLYVPITFVLFNVGDLGGRFLAEKLDIAVIPNFSTKLVLAALFRCLFFPLFLLCVAGTNPNRLEIRSDVYSFLVQSLFALSNGVLISLGFMHAPTLIPETLEAQEKSSEILTFALSAGLLCGSLLSFPVAELTS